MIEIPNEFQLSIRRLRKAIYIGVVLLFVCLLAWSSVASIDTAVVAVGEIRPGGHTRPLQQLEGGVVEEVIKHDGDTVKTGEALYVLKDDGRRTELDLLEISYQELLVRREYLRARLAGERSFTVPTGLASKAEIEPLRGIIQEYQNLITSGVETDEMLDQTTRRHLEAQEAAVDGTTERVTALESAIQRLKDELATMDSSESSEAFRRQVLVENLASLSAELDAATQLRDSAIASVDDLNAQAASRSQQADLETQSESTSMESDLANLELQLRRARDDVAALTVTSPIDGVVHEVRPVEIGKSIAPGEVAMEVAPQVEELTALLRIQPSDIDAVAVGSPVVVKLSAFAPGLVPDLHGVTTMVASGPDVDSATGISSYQVEVLVSAEELARLSESNNVVPGMPVEAFMSSGRSSVLNYLLSPLLDQIRRSAPG